MEEKTQAEVVVPMVKQKSNLLDGLTNVIVTAVIALGVTWAYTNYVPNKKDAIYVIDYVEIINLKKAELMAAFQAGDNNSASKASAELETLIQKSADVVSKFSKETGRPVFNKQLLVTFDGTTDITPQVKAAMIKEGIIKETPTK